MIPRFLLTFLLLAPAALPSEWAGKTPSKDPLTRAFQIWFADYKAGRISPRDVKGPLKKPYLSAKLLTELPTVLGRYSRVEEARQLFRLLRKRGTEEDGKRLVAVVLVGARKKEGLLIGGRFWRIRRAAIEVLSGKDVSPGFKVAVLDRVKDGLLKPESWEEGRPFPFKHKQTVTARLLAPVIGSHGSSIGRTILEDLLRVDDQDVQAASAEGLAKLGSGSSIEKVAGVLANLRYHDLLVTVADAIMDLCKATNPPPDEGQLLYSLKAVLDLLESRKNWRTRLVFLPAVRRIRSKASVPVLIRLLEEGKANRKDHEAFSGTLLHSVLEALEDLTGFFAEADQPEKWRAWWEAEQDRFALVPVKDNSHPEKGTRAGEFFGIPVTGSRVAFILDVSGSMAWPMNGGPFDPRAPVPKKGTYISRLDRAKEELLKAVGSLTSDDRFNLVLFESRVRTWRKDLVRATKVNKRALKSTLDKTDAYGATAIYDALEAALKIKLSRKRTDRYSSMVDEIFFLSDGAPTAGSVRDPKRILELVATWNRGARVRINTVFMGETSREAMSRAGMRLTMAPEELMKRLAEGNKGRFRQVK